MRETRQSGFDEREQETGPGQTGLRWRGESQSHIHREATVTAPVLDSTLWLQQLTFGSPRQLSARGIQRSV